MLLIFKNNAYFEHLEHGDILWNIPSLSTNVGSVSEVIIDKKTGFVLDYNSKDFDEKIIEIYVNSEIRSEFGQFAKNFTKAQFHVERLARDHQATYLELIN